MSAQALRFVHGTVVTQQDNLPLEAAAVFERSSGNQTFTDENGFFTLVLEGENPRITVEFLGLKPLEVAIAQTDNLTIELPAATDTKKARNRKKYAFVY